MRQFGGYTLERLLELTFQDFMLLHELAVQAQADQALETVAAGMAAYHERDIRPLCVRRGDFAERQKSDNALPSSKFTREEYDTALAIAREYTEAQGETLQIKQFKVGGQAPL